MHCLVDFCRFCLSFKGDFHNMSCGDILEKANACIGDFEFYRSLPNLICSNCLERLDLCFDFRNRCLQSELTLHRYVRLLTQYDTLKNRFINRKLSVMVSSNFGGQFVSSKSIQKVSIRETNCPNDRYFCGDDDLVNIVPQFDSEKNSYCDTDTELQIDEQPVKMQGMSSRTPENSSDSILISNTKGLIDQDLDVNINKLNTKLESSLWEDTSSEICDNTTFNINGESLTCQEDISEVVGSAIVASNRSTEEIFDKPAETQENSISTLFSNIESLIQQDIGNNSSIKQTSISQEPIFEVCGYRIPAFSLNGESLICHENSSQAIGTATVTSYKESLMNQEVMLQIPDNNIFEESKSLYQNRLPSIDTDRPSSNQLLVPSQTKRKLNSVLAHTLRAKRTKINDYKINGNETVTPLCGFTRQETFRDNFVHFTNQFRPVNPIVVENSDKSRFHISKPNLPSKSHCIITCETKPPLKDDTISDFENAIALHHIWGERAPHPTPCKAQLSSRSLLQKNLMPYYPKLNEKDNQTKSGSSDEEIKRVQTDVHLTPHTQLLIMQTHLEKNKHCYVISKSPSSKPVGYHLNVCEEHNYSAPYKKLTINNTSTRKLDKDLKIEGLAQTQVVRVKTPILSTPQNEVTPDAKVSPNCMFIKVPIVTMPRQFKVATNTEAQESLPQLIIFNEDNPVSNYLTVTSHTNGIKYKPHPQPIAMSTTHQGEVSEPHRQPTTFGTHQAQEPLSEHVLIREESIPVANFVTAATEPNDVKYNIEEMITTEEIDLDELDFVIDERWDGTN